MFINKNQNIREFENLLKLNYTSTKVKLYMATKGPEDGYDPYENNLITTNLNPHTIKAYVREVRDQQLIYKHYGLTNIGAVEVICTQKYLSWFKMANKIVISDIDYRILSVGNAQGSTYSPKAGFFSTRPFNMAKIVLTRAD